jgi:hypothetical protein
LRRGSLEHFALPRHGKVSLWLQAVVPARSPARRLSGGVQPLEPRTSASHGFGGFALSSRHGGQMAWKAVPDPKPTFRISLTRSPFSPYFPDEFSFW